MSHKILLSNIGYARGINGALAQHLVYAHRHFYCTPAVQKESLRQLSAIIEKEDPDICCLVEVDKGSFTSANFNQLEALITERYPYFGIENKYARTSKLRSFLITRGKSNAFIAKKKYDFDKLFFNCGSKRLIYKISLEKELTLFFAHFSLRKSVRVRQLLEVRELIRHTSGHIIFLGDFNVLTGLTELAPLLHENDIVLLNKPDLPTFTFYKHRLVLDLCVCSRGIADRMEIKVIPQPYSDHAALVVEVASLAEAALPRAVADTSI